MDPMGNIIQLVPGKLPAPGSSGCHLRPRSSPCGAAAHATRNCAVAVDGGRSTAAGGVGDPCSSAEETWHVHRENMEKEIKKMGTSRKKLRIFRCVDRENVGRLDDYDDSTIEFLGN